MNVAVVVSRVEFLECSGRGGWTGLHGAGRRGLVRVPSGEDPQNRDRPPSPTGPTRSL